MKRKQNQMMSDMMMCHLTASKPFHHQCITPNLYQPKIYV